TYNQEVSWLPILFSEEPKIIKKGYTMIGKYFVIALRRTFRDKTFSLINLIGLSISMASVILIMVFMYNELTFDTFHQNSDRIFRVLRETESLAGAPQVSPGTSGMLGQSLVADIPEIEKVTRFFRMSQNWATNEDKGFFVAVCAVDQEFLQIFSFPLKIGDPKTVLKDKFSVVITEETAQKFFANENPIGKTISVDGRYFGGDYFVSGVVKDTPRNSSLHFDILTSTVHNEIPLTAWERWQPNTSWRPIQTFVMLSDAASPKNIDTKLQDLLNRYMGPDVSERNRYILQPLERMYLYSNLEYGIRGGGDITYVYIFSAIAIFIVLIASFNFVNLSIARSAARLKEIGVRKTVGAHKSSLIFQFIAEAVFTAFCSSLLAFCIVEISLPYLDSYINQEGKLEFSGHFLFVITFLTALIIGTISGLYPALFLASFHPAQILRRELQFNNSGKWLRNGSLIFQFAASVVLIISTIVVYKQMAFIQNKALGFDKERIVVLPLFTTDRSLNERYRVIKQEFLKHPNVISASASNSTIAWFGGAFHTVYPEGFQGNEWQMRILGVDEDFIDLYGITLSKGRNFSVDIPGDATDAYILNETAVEQLGWQNPIGKQFEWAYWKRKGIVIGVVEDFHNRSLKEPIRPIALCMWQPKYNLLSLKIRGENIKDTMAFLEDQWRRFIPDKPFKAAFLDEHLNQLYQNDINFGRIFGVFALLAIFIACLGMLGMVSYALERRTKEIGIRKILGASAWNIIVLIFSEFFGILVVANLFAWLIAFLLMDNWLLSFAYKIELSPHTFALGTLFAIAITFATVARHLIQAASKNPIDKIRYE
ncbi:MAG: FtsX-like permease family protein, partial [Gemmatimonadetes bacterium]|nr:FtsX-like permease family protein [Gemmatimonadota bacterium]